MSTNPVEPGSEVPAVCLWNPNAVANWCLLFTPAFGSYLQMLNWEALGRPDEAKKSRWWFYIAVGLLIVYVLGGALLLVHKEFGGLFRPVGFAFLLAWYFASGRRQARFVKATYGNAYPRRSWAQPLLIAFGAAVAYSASVFVVNFVVVLFVVNHR